MGRTSLSYGLIAFIFIFSFTCTIAQDADPISQKSILDGIKIAGQWFVGYFNTDDAGVTTSEFAIKRGYITTIKKFNDRISARLTQDITVDRQGDGKGDIELRIKYAYVKYIFGDLGFLTKPAVEFGVVHRPWLNYEQKINDYRSQGQMFLERVGVINSADYGIYFETLLGGKMPGDYQKNVSKSFPGKYGSFAIGLFNGGGYNELEENENKSIETRLSIRPMPYLIPGLQITYLGLFGKGNTPEAPEHNINSGFLSYECSEFTATASYYTGKGLQDGTGLDASGNSVDQSGYSFFGEYKLPQINMSLIGRLDYFKAEFSPFEQEYKGWIAGVAYHFLKGSKILLAYDTVDLVEGNTNTTSIFEATVELRF